MIRVIVQRMLLPASLLLVATIPAARATCDVQSAGRGAHLVELYTSEGCDSCPPAERWMSTLRKHADLIGLEFHVDYWDSSSWRDPFSDHSYTVRQQALAKRGNKDQIYTPQIWLDGHVWYNWPKGAPPEPVGAPAPPLRVRADADDTLRVHIEIDATASRPDYRIYAALSESGLSENVRGGENRGKTLAHDEVVRAFAGPLNPPQADVELKIPARVAREKASVVAFVQDEGDGSIVQAIRVPLTECKK